MLSAPWYALMQRSVVRRAPYVIYVTEKFLQRRYPTRGREVGISNVQLEQPSVSVLERRLHHIERRTRRGGPIKLVTVADVAVPYKGQGDIISMLPALSSAGVEVEYHLVGDGDQTRLKSLARRLGVELRVVFHGILRHDSVFGLLEEMDIYVQPSHQEGLPRAVIEAMSRGLPAIGARTGGIPELLEPSRVFRAGDGNGFMASLTGILPPTEQVADSRRNFLRAQDFRAKTLAARRRAFYAQFLRENRFTNESVSSKAGGD